MQKPGARASQTEATACAKAQMGYSVACSLNREGAEWVKGERYDTKSGRKAEMMLARIPST